MVRLDSAGEEGDLAAWRAVQAKVRHSMVRIIWKNDTLPPNQGHILNEQENHRSPISVRILHVRWNHPHEHMDMDNGNDRIAHRDDTAFRNIRRAVLFQFWPSTFPFTVLMSCAED